jgi:protein ImuB
MSKRFVSIWFRHLATDWFTLRQPELRDTPFVLSVPSHGRLVISASNALAESEGVYPGMVVADAKALIPYLKVIDEIPGLSEKLLQRIAAWCIRYSPVVAVDEPEGLLFDATGCAHLWGGEQDYLTAISKRFSSLGYDVRVAMADTIGCAWAVARFSQQSLLIKSDKHLEALLPLPPQSLRIETETEELLHKLGFLSVGQFITMPRASLSRRFGDGFMRRLDQALGTVEEMIEPVKPPEPYQERLTCLEPISTRSGIDIALERLLDILCKQLQQEQKGLRTARFSVYRIDGKVQHVEISTHRPSHNSQHLCKLFEIRIDTIEPGPGIELFVLEATKVEDHSAFQQKIWQGANGIHDGNLSELLDRVTGKFGAHIVHRYLPVEHYWPERSVKRASSLQEMATTSWKVDRPRPLQLLSIPQRIDVTAPIPDYPPMLFRYKGKLHTVKKADGPRAH